MRLKDRFEEHAKLQIIGSLPPNMSRHPDSVNAQLINAISAYVADTRYRWFLSTLSIVTSILFHYVRVALE